MLELVRVLDRVDVAVAVLDAVDTEEPELEPVLVPVGRDVLVEDAVFVAVLEAVATEVAELEPVLVLVGGGVLVEDAVIVALFEPEAVLDELSVDDDVETAVVEDVAVADSVKDGVADVVDDTVAESVAVGVPVRVWTDEWVEVAVDVELAVAVAVDDAETDEVDVAEAVDVPVELLEEVGDSEGDTDTEGELVGVGEHRAVGVRGGSSVTKFSAVAPGGRASKEADMLKGPAPALTSRTTNTSLSVSGRTRAECVPKHFVGEKFGQGP